MVDPISVIRQMMAESKFYEAQKTTELHLSSQNGTSRAILLPLYLELLELQDKRLPEELIIEAAEVSVDVDLDQSIMWLEKLKAKTASQNFQRIQILKIKMAEKKGRLEELYKLISEFKMHLFESKVPANIEFVDMLISKYFKYDFHLKLQQLAIALMLCDITKAEAQVSELICSCVEKASPKGTREKLLSIAEIINTQKEKKQLEIYQSYSRIAAEGIKDKSEYKRLVEMVIYFDDFKFQVLVLDLMEKLGLSEASSEYALDVRSNSGYDFVYIEKYFGHLKRFFAPSNKRQNQDKKLESLVPDFELERPLASLELDKIVSEPVNEEESLIISALKYQTYTSHELIELSVSFLQSRFPRACSEAAGLAMRDAANNVEYLKACYLKATSLYHLADFRAVLDFSMDAISKAETQDDILSFLYLQSEAYSQMGLKKDARRILKKILSIDEKYRLTRERLERLDEI
ncbi:MAG TPA: hypothetical protein VNJ08_00115 [Bacteriovoracaceae bacterium]|nr:hypothetical protein [Bacteriovoracaceae bacterium]